MSGRFDSSTLDTLKKDLIAEERLKYTIADMKQTTFIDSLGLAALVSALKVMRSRGGDFFIVNPTDVVRLLLELTRMDAVFTLYPTLEDAQAAFTA